MFCGCAALECSVFVLVVISRASFDYQNPLCVCCSAAINTHRSLLRHCHVRIKHFNNRMYVNSTGLHDEI